MSEEIDDVKTKISFLFTYYTNFGEKTNGKLLKSTKFHKMMHDSGVKDDSGLITSTNLDLLFFSETKHNSHISYEIFLNFIPKLAREKYPNEPDVQAFKRLMDMNLLPLAMKLMKDSEMGEEKQQLMQEIDEVTIRVLEYVAPVLFKIYMVMKINKLVILNLFLLKGLFSMGTSKLYEKRRRFSKNSNLPVFFRQRL